MAAGTVPGGVFPSDSAIDIWGCIRADQTPHASAVCQLAGIGAAALILPCLLIDLAFDTDFLNMLMQAALVGVALALMVAVWTDREE